MEQYPSLHGHNTHNIGRYLQTDNTTQAIGSTERPPMLSQRLTDALTIWFGLMAIAIVVLGLLYRAGWNATRADVAAQESRGVQEAALTLSAHLEWVQRDLRSLSKLGRHLQPGASGELDEAAFAQALIDWVEPRTDVYALARYIDETGQERVRVDSQSTGLRVLPHEQLQNKRDRYYFTQAMQAPVGTIVISRFDLNEEHGRIEVPYNPVIRFSTRLADPAGQPRGILVINVRAQPLIDRISGTKLAPGAEMWMLNQSGGQLIGSVASPAWAFMDPKATKALLGERDPALWAAIQTSSRGEVQLLDVPGGLLSATAFVPQDRLRLPGIALQGEEGMVWYIAVWMPDAAFSAHLQPLRNRILAGGAVMALVFVLIAWYGSHLRLRRRQVQDALARSEAQYRELLASAPDAIVVTDSAGTVLYANAHTEKLFGYLPNELVGVHVDTLMPARFRQTHQENMRRHARTPPGRHEMASGRAIFALRRDGGEFPATIGLNKIDSDQGPRVIATIQDMTDIRAAQAAMTAANRQLSAVNKDLESFSYSVAHDLRSPLRVLHGFGELLMSEHQHQLDAQGRTHLERMLVAAQHMGSILTGMLELSRVTRSSMAPQPLDLSAMAQEMVDLLRAEHPDREVEVRIETDMKAHGDPSLIKIVLLNLWSNAWKFTSKREQARIDMGMQWRDGRREFFVRDNGAGFDSARANLLFDAFQRLHRAEEFPGTGIGLATVARVIEKHGGQIRAEAAVGQGACFFFSLGEIEADAIGPHRLNPEKIH